MDTFMAATAMNALIWLLAIVIVFAGMWAYGLEHAIPESIPDCGMALFLLIMAGIPPTIAAASGVGSGSPS